MESRHSHARGEFGVVVMQFDRRCLRDSGAVSRAVRIIKHRLPYKTVVVVGAFADVSQQLLRAAQSAAEGEQDSASCAVQQLRERHHKVASAVTSGSELQNLFCMMEEEFDALLDLVKGIAAIRELTPRTLNGVLESGEQVACWIMASALLHAGMNVKAVEREAVLRGIEGAERAKDFGAFHQRIAAALQPVIDDGAIPVLSAGRANGGLVSGSAQHICDLSAGQLAAALNAQSLELWTDVDGISSIDPALGQQARVIEELSFAEAFELAESSNDELRLKTLYAAAQKNIPVRVLNIYDPQRPGTRIGPGMKGSGRVKAVAVRREVAILEMQSPQKPASELLTSVYRAFEGSQQAPEVVSASAGNVCLLVKAAPDLVEIVRVLKGVAEVQWTNHKSLVCLVGEKIRSHPEIVGQAVRGLHGINVRLLCHGGSECNISFLIDDGDTEETAKRLHRVFFAGELSVKTGERQSVPAAVLCQAGEPWV